MEAQSLTASALLLVLACSVPATAAPSDDPDVARARQSIERFAKDPFEQRAREAALRALGRIGGREAAEVVATVMDDPFVHLRDHAVSALIAMCRGPRAVESIAWITKVALVDRRRAALRRGAATALGIVGHADGVRALGAAVAKENDAGVLVALADALGRGMDDDGATSLAMRLASKDPDVVGAAARALGRTRAKGDATAALLEPILAHGHASARVGAIDGLSIASPEVLATHLDTLVIDKAIEPRIATCDGLALLGTKAIGTLASLLDDASWRVRVAAYEAAISIWSKDVIPLLIERSRTEAGRLQADAFRALRTITGADVGPDSDLWNAWWKAKGAALDLGPRPAIDRYGRIRRAAPSGASFDPTKTAAFFRLPIHSKRLAFVFDFSGSMRDPVEGGGSGTKAELARLEFARVMAGLSNDQFFDLFIHRYPSVFPPAPLLTRALGALAPGGDASARKAIGWLSKEEPKGWGAFYDALVAIAADELDTIVLLSDGVPSRGTYDRDFRLIPEFVKANRFRRVAVDTVLVGRTGSDRTFLSDLADATGGRFQDATERAHGK